MVIESKEVYKFKDQGLLAIASLIIALVFAVIAIAALKASSVVSVGGATAVLATSVVFLFGSIVSLRAKSQVVVDKECISRKLFGVIWRRIYWSHIEKITVTPFFNAAMRKQLRIITIIPSAHGSVGISNKISFVDQLERMDQLVKYINLRIEKHDITIQLVENGRNVALSRL